MRLENNRGINGGVISQTGSREPVNHKTATAGVFRQRTPRIFCFFGGICLQMLGIALFIAVIWYLIMQISDGGGSGALLLSWKTAAEVLEGFLPYLLVAGGVSLWMSPMFLFANYVPVMISMNATRRLTAVGLWLCEGAVLLAVVGIEWLLSALGYGTLQREWLPLVFAAGMLMAMVGFLFGMVSVRWRTAGMILNIVLCMSIGFLCGVFMGLQMEEIDIFHMSLWEWMHSPVLPVVGFVLYAATGAACLKFLRKTEIRR